MGQNYMEDWPCFWGKNKNRKCTRHLGNEGTVIYLDWTWPLSCVEIDVLSQIFSFAFTDWPEWRFQKKNRRNWHAAHDLLHVTHRIWYGTHGMWYMTCDTWHVSHDMWHIHDSNRESVRVKISTYEMSVAVSLTPSIYPKWANCLLSNFAYYMFLAVGFR